MSRIILTRGVNEYRAAIKHFLNVNDCILEIGFAWGTTSNLIYKKCQNLVAIDKSPSYFNALEKYPDIEFYQYDCFDIAKLIALNKKFNKIFIDISGCRDIYSYLKVINIYESVFKPELMIVKSSKLKRLINKCEVFNKHSL